MESCALQEKLLEESSESRMPNDQYDSVEFAVNGLDNVYQFKIWSIPPTSMCVLVKEDSDILPRLKVGEELNLRYYTPCSAFPTGYMKTSIRHITKKDQGRFQGHSLVGLAIMERKDQEEIH